MTSKNREKKRARLSVDKILKASTLGKSSQKIAKHILFKYWKAWEALAKK